MTGEPLPAPSSVSVSVENGTGTYDEAAETGFALGTIGFHVVGLGDVAPQGDVAETVVYYGSLAPSAEAAAEAVAHDMTGSVIMGYDPSQVTDGAEVTVVTGSQFAVSAPATDDHDELRQLARVDDASCVLDIIFERHLCSVVGQPCPCPLGPASLRTRRRADRSGAERTLSLAIDP